MSAAPKPSKLPVRDRFSDTQGHIMTPKQVARLREDLKHAKARKS
jgi:hypothetical protein